MRECLVYVILVTSTFLWFLFMVLAVLTICIRKCLLHAICVTSTFYRFFFMILTVRTALTALIAFMPTNPSGALGSLDYKKEERRVLAVKSREAAPNFGNPERQKLIDEIHDYMLSKAPPVPELGSTQDAEENSTVGEAGPLPAGVQAESEELQNPAVDDRIVEQQDEGPFNANPAERIVVARQVTTGNPSEQHQLLQRPATRVQRPADDWLFTLAAVGLTIAIAYLLVKKFLKASEFGTFSMNGS
ncbi:hypothetical protein AgCh_002586 [Apium graveolens]